MTALLGAAGGGAAGAAGTGAAAGAATAAGESALGGAAAGAAGSTLAAGAGTGVASAGGLGASLGSLMQKGIGQGSLTAGDVLDATGATDTMKSMLGNGKFSDLIRQQEIYSKKKQTPAQEMYPY